MSYFIKLGNLIIMDIQLFPYLFGVLLFVSCTTGCEI